MAQYHRLFQYLMLCNLIALTKFIYSVMIDQIVSIYLLFVALKNFSSFPSNIRSIQIILHPSTPNFVSSNWSILRSLSALPILVLMIVFVRLLQKRYQCWFILIFVSVDSSRLSHNNDDNEDDRFATLKTTSNDYQASIKALHRRILCSTLHMKPLIVIEEESCELFVWL